MCQAQTAQTRPLGQVAISFPRGYINLLMYCAHTGSSRGGQREAREEETETQRLKKGRALAHLGRGESRKPVPTSTISDLPSQLPGSIDRYQSCTVKPRMTSGPLGEGASRNRP